MKDGVDEPLSDIEAEMVSLSPHRVVKDDGEEPSLEIEAATMF